MAMTVAIYLILRDLFQLYSYMMIAWIILSWIPNLRTAPIVVVLGRLVDPYLSLFRRIIPSMGGIDFSPIIAFFVFRIIQGLVFGQILPLIFGWYGAPFG